MTPSSPWTTEKQDGELCHLTIPYVAASEDVPDATCYGIVTAAFFEADLTLFRFAREIAELHALDWREVEAAEPET